MQSKEDKEMRIKEIEVAMQQADFWNDSGKAQALIREMNDLKIELEGGTKYDKGDAVVTILSGAGGDDAEDFSGILFRMYQKYIDNQGWVSSIVHQNENDHGGFRNITFEVQGKNVYGMLRNESGVHRLVRISPFNAKKLRHTSFSLVEVIPKFEAIDELEIPEDDFEVTFSKSSGPGGQNANKRETAVRVTHTSTKMSVHIESERSQAQNKEKAIALLSGKLFKRLVFNIMGDELEIMYGKAKGRRLCRPSYVGSCPL
jgi:peptide chain release factor 2